MSGVINWLKGNTIYIVTLTLYGDPDGHLDSISENNVDEHKKSPFQQWIFNSGQEAIDAAQGIAAAVDESTGEDLGVKLKENIMGSSQDILLCVELYDKSDDTVQFRIYVTAYQKQGKEWL
tara:strand:+ start:9865 stop:10227 length:363 start_codon:yes stop_codon:yes gene_type:complete